MIDRLGWTLVHFLWQGLAIALVYTAVRQSLARAWSSQARYLLACAALGTMLAAPLVTWVLLQPPQSRSNAAYGIQITPAVSAAAPAGLSLPSAARSNGSGWPAAQWLHWVVLVWLAGAAAFWVRLAGGWVMAARMRSVQVRRAPPEWQATLTQLGDSVGVSRPVRLLVSALVHTPTVVGWLKPVVLVPVGVLAGLPAGQLEALLLHELAHIRRHDYLVNILQSIAEALLFYHPAVWWVSANIRAERELCCDDLAVAVNGDALTYARALAQLESNRPAHATPALGASGGSLSDRIARLLGESRPKVRTGLGPGAVAVAVLLAAAYGLVAQSDQHPAFQAASIHRNTSDWSQRIHHRMGLGVNSSLLLMIQFVYAAHDNPMLGHSLPLLTSQVIGGPPWIDSVRYDIQVTPEHTDPKQMWLMWQTLLTDSFQLRVHRETRELPVYNLTAAAAGLKLAPAASADCISFPPGTKPHYEPGKVDCGYVTGPMARSPNGMQHIEGSKIHMADLARELAAILDRPVLDQTGFHGEFDLNLSFGPNAIAAALQDQLGLKLESAKGPVEVLVVDHAKQPLLN